MNIKFKRVALTIAAVCGLALVGCSSTSHEPAELADINQLVDSDSVWSQSVGGSVTGLVTPFLTQSGLYAAGGNTLYKLDPRRVKKNGRLRPMRKFRPAWAATANLWLSVPSRAKSKCSMPLARSFGVRVFRQK